MIIPGNQVTASAGGVLAPAPFQVGGDSRRVHLHFRLAYPTKWGQNVVMLGAGALLGNWNLSRATKLNCRHDKEALLWEALVSLPWAPRVCYKYAVVRYGEGGEVQLDKAETHTREMELPEGLQHGDIVDIHDTWLDASHPSSIYSTAAFTKVVKPPRPAKRGGRIEAKKPMIGEAVIHFRVADTLLEEGHTLCVTGGIPQLGNWQQDTMLQLTETTSPWWEGEMRVPYSLCQFTYKYAIRNREGLVLMEVGEPRVVSLPVAANNTMGAPAVLRRDDGYFRRDKLWRGAGVAVPVFSLRTHHSVGVGEFLDLIQLVDLADTCGFRLVQILPVNDTSVWGTWWDSYPYSSISVFALHPQYLALRGLRRELPEGIKAEIEEARGVLDGKGVDYEGVMAAKLRIARKVFDAFGKETTETAEFKEWVSSNSDWLQPYAAFLFLKDLFGTAQHWQWGALAKPSHEVLTRLVSPDMEYYPRILFCYWLQYHLHCQLMTVARHARTKRVVLKGDLPIGVDKASVDTWLQPRLFRMDKSTGSPPDYFDPNGQNWGFPTYNWEEMAKDKFGWWQRRLRHMSQYFSAYRIDHILGFFRIWEIPGDCVTGMLGHFRPSLPLSRSELEAKGLWDMDRLTQPYVRLHLLEQIFGEQAADIAARYFVEPSPGVFRLRPQYGSEQQIMAIKVRDDSPQWLKDETDKVRKGLMKLRQNVVLLPDPENPDAFYPRIGLMSTSSCRELPQAQREALAALHDDYFFKRQEDLWRESAMKKLPELMAASDMLVCGEDLGFVPACVPPVMQELGLIGLRIQRMPCESGREFNTPGSYPYLAVASPSCHDVTPIRAWWEEDSERRERFFYSMLGGCGPAPERCTPDVVRHIVLQHMNCPSVWAIYPIQDLMALSHKYCARPACEEVINDPTNPRHYWRFRLHVSLEEIQGDSELVACLQDMVVLSERTGTPLM